MLSSVHGTRIHKSVLKMETPRFPIGSLVLLEACLLSFAGVPGVSEHQLGIKRLSHEAVEELVLGMPEVWIRELRGPDADGVSTLVVEKSIDDGNEATRQIVEYLTDENRPSKREWTFMAPMCRETILPLLGRHAAEIRSYSTDIICAGKWRLTLQT
jgi:hypothetical protein